MSIHLKQHLDQIIEENRSMRKHIEAQSETIKSHQNDLYTLESQISKLRKALQDHKSENANIKQENTRLTKQYQKQERLWNYRYNRLRKYDPRDKLSTHLATELENTQKRNLFLEQLIEVLGIQYDFDAQTLITLAEFADNKENLKRIILNKDDSSSRKKLTQKFKLNIDPKINPIFNTKLSSDNLNPKRIPENEL